MSGKEMQMEFERRLQLISPDLAIDNKPNSDLIFSVLNEAQDRFVIQNYVGDDQTELDTNTFNRNIDAIKTLFVEKQLLSSGTNVMGFPRFRLPNTENDEYFLYSNSYSHVTGTYKQKTDEQVIANKLIKYRDLQNYVTTAFNSPIVRQPAAALMSDTTTKYQYLVVATDKYTKLNSVTLDYYRRPLRFDWSGKCELPESVHSEIVDLAVDMFIAEYKYRLQVKPQSEQQ